MRGLRCFALDFLSSLSISRIRRLWQPSTLCQVDPKNFGRISDRALNVSDILAAQSQVKVTIKQQIVILKERVHTKQLSASRKSMSNEVLTEI